MSSVVLSKSYQPVPTITKMPQFDIEAMKSKKQKKVEQKYNIEQPQGAKSVAKEAVDNAIKMLQKTLSTSEYNVSLTLDNLGSERNVRLTQKSTGETLVELPPQIAVQMADRAEKQTIGMLIDLTA